MVSDVFLLCVLICTVVWAWPDLDRLLHGSGHQRVHHSFIINTFHRSIIYSLSTLVLQAFKTALGLVIIVLQIKLVILLCFQGLKDVLVSMQLQLVIESLCDCWISST